MVKKLRVFFCLILVVILPLCFVACKSSETPPITGGSPSSGGGNEGGSSGESTGPSGGETPPEQGNTPEITYVIDNAEINRILKASYDVCEDFIIDLNNSNLLSDNNYTNDEGGKTYPVFDYAFYPARFAMQYTGGFEQEKLYARQVSTTMKYFEVKASESNDKVFATMLLNDISTDGIKYVTSAYFYEFAVTNGTIDSLKISYIDADTSLIRFSETMLDFKNSVCEIALGTINEFSATRTFLERNFTSEKFALISSERWGYSYYQKFDFSSNRTYVLNKAKMPSNNDMIEAFDSFGFLGVFDKLDEYAAKGNLGLTGLSQDYFLYCSTNGMIIFNSENTTFEFKTEEE